MEERMDTMEQKTERNIRVQARYDELMREGKRGHYETLFRVVREEVEAERERWAGVEQYLIAAADGSMSRNNSQQLAAELLAAIRGN
jgi:hypothetical protein